MKNSNEEDFVVVYAGNQPDASFLKTLFEQNEIPSFLKDEIMGSISTAFTIGGVKVIVMKKDLEKAKVIVHDFLNSSPDNK